MLINKATKLRNPEATHSKRRKGIEQSHALIAASAPLSRRETVGHMVESGEDARALATASRFDMDTEVSSTTPSRGPC